MAKKLKELSSRSMNKLWAPWRIGYIQQKKQKGCFFCSAKKNKDDRKNHIIKRSKHCFAILNLYPYNNGHIMIVPNRHLSDWEDLSCDEITDIHCLTSLILKKLRKTIKPHGFNLGVNLGLVAGAGIPGHVHLHIVPRWNGDTNFMPITGSTKIISQSLDQLYQLLKKN